MDESPIFICAFARHSSVQAQAGQRKWRIVMHPRSAFDVTLILALFMGSVFVIALIGPANAKSAAAAFCTDSAIAGEQKQLEKLVEVAGDVSCKQQQSRAPRKFAI
jgi:hypothetical protein